MFQCDPLIVFGILAMVFAPLINSFLEKLIFDRLHLSFWFYFLVSVLAGFLCVALGMAFGWLIEGNLD